MALTLVTGATGFLGNGVVSQLLSAGARVRTTARRLRPDQWLPEFRPLDLARCYTLRPLLRDVSCIVHVAELAHHFGRHRDGAPFHQMNAMATARLAHAATEAGVRRFVFVSSAAVYGPHSGEIEEYASCRPCGAYGQSKLDAEKSLAETAAASRMQVVVLRPVTLFGEHDPGDVGRLLRALDRGRFVWIGEGSNRKSLLHRDDVARACVLAALRPPRQSHACYNVAGPATTMREIVTQLCAALDRNPPRWRMPVGLIKNLLPGASRRRATLEKWLSDDLYCGRRFADEYNFEPHIDLAEGLQRQVDAYRGGGIREVAAKAA